MFTHNGWSNWVLSDTKCASKQNHAQWDLNLYTCIYNLMSTGHSHQATMETTHLYKPIYLESSRNRTGRVLCQWLFMFSARHFFLTFFLTTSTITACVKLFRIKDWYYTYTSHIDLTAALKTTFHNSYLGLVGGTAHKQHASLCIIQVILQAFIIHSVQAGLTIWHIHVYILC